MKIKRDYLYLIGIALIIIYFLIDRCNHDRQLRIATNDLIGYTDSVTVLKGYISKNKALSVEKETLSAILAREKKDNEKLREQVRLYSSISSFTKVKTEFSIDTVKIGFDSIPCDFERTLNIDSPDFKFSAHLSNTSFILLNLKIPNEQSFIVGKFNGKGFKRREAAITLTNSNSHMVVTGMESYTVSAPKKRWYEKSYVWGAAGFLAAWIIK